MNIYGQMGVPSGCRFSSEISGIVYLPPEKMMPPITAAAITISSTPKIGYSLPISLSMGKRVARR